MKEFLARLSDYHREDERISSEIHDVLWNVYKESVAFYPMEKNLVSIFYVDMLKFVSGAALRARELEHGLVKSDEALYALLKGWPYFGYSEIKNPEFIRGQRKGRKINLAKDWKRKLLEKFSSLASALRLSNRQMGVAANFSETDLIIGMIKRGFRVRFLTLSQNELRIPGLNAQLRFIDLYFNRLAPLLPSQLDPKMMRDLFVEHVLATATEGALLDLGKLDELILNSGSELPNRYLAACARAAGIPVIGLIHGDSFGLLDNHVFGTWEQHFCDVIVGYGDAYAAHRKNYRYIDRPNVVYVGGSSPEVVKLQKSEAISSIVTTNNSYYVPTSIRGNQRRYGLHQELVDGYYLDWQKLVLTQMPFLKMKAHPKDMFLGVVARHVGSEIETRNLLELLDQADFLVFDYFSTAFVYAAATSLPILFLDLGIQDLCAPTMTMLRDRCVYIDVLKEGMPDMEAVKHRFTSEQKTHASLIPFCVSEAPGRFGALWAYLGGASR